MKQKEICCICKEVELDEDDNRMSDGRGGCQKCYFEIENW